MIERRVNSEFDEEKALTAALKEYEALRAEISWLIAQSVQLQSFAIALSVGIFPLVTFFLEERSPGVLVGVLVSLPIALCLLGALYFRQHQEVYVVASSIQAHIRPLIVEVCGRSDLWQWEEYKDQRLYELSRRSPIHGAWTPAGVLILRLALFVLPASMSLILGVSIAVTTGLDDLTRSFTVPGMVVLAAVATLDAVAILILLIRFAKEGDFGRILLATQGASAPQRDAD
jgi:hypothetical protein